MYKLPIDFDGEFIRGKILELVSFSENTVFFAFEEKVSITVESSIQHQLPGSVEQVEKQSVPPLYSCLMQLVGHTATRVAGDADGTLVIEFDHGHVLRIFDDSTNYESYIMNDGHHEVIV